MLAGIIELTNGLKLVSSNSVINYNLSIIISSFLLGFGGISVLLQVASIVSKTDLSMKKYVVGKFLQGIISTIYVSIILSFIPEYNKQSMNVSFTILIGLLVIITIMLYIISRKIFQKRFAVKKM